MHACCRSAPSTDVTAPAPHAAASPHAAATPSTAEPSTRPRLLPPTRPTCDRDAPDRGHAARQRLAERSAWSAVHASARHGCAPAPCLLVVVAGPAGAESVQFCCHRVDQPASSNRLCTCMESMTATQGCEPCMQCSAARLAPADTAAASADPTSRCGCMPAKRMRRVT